jgi:outer membrane protein assembly factor BamB
MCIDPKDGSVDFEFPWRGDRYESVNASSPVVIGDRVFVSECYGTGSAMVDVLADGSAKLAWKNDDFGTHFMTAIHHDGYLYGVHGHGPLDSPIVCLDAKTGKEMWREEPVFVETVKRGDVERKVKLNLARASLVYVDGRFLCLGEYGHLLWLDLTPKGYRESSRCWLFFAGETWTGPVISKGLLYVCQNQQDAATRKGARLICYDLRE